MFSKKKHNIHAKNKEHLAHDKEHVGHGATHHHHNTHQHKEKRGVITSYLAHVRRQSFEVQQIHAAVFAGAVTLLVGFFVFYRDFGIGTERYSSTAVIKEAVLTEKKIETESESPIEFISSFVSEAKTRLDAIGTGSSSFFEATKEYSREE